MAKKKKIKLTKEQRQLWELTKHTTTNLEEWLEKYGDMKLEDYKMPELCMDTKVYVPKFRYVHAMQWAGKNYEEVCAFLGYRPKLVNRNKGLIINSWCGTKVCVINDYLTYDGIFGFDMVKADAFSKMYTLPVTDDYEFIVGRDIINPMQNIETKELPTKTIYTD